MKFYAAGNINDRVKVKELMDKMTVMGHTITHDWTSAQPTDSGWPLSHVRNDTTGVILADAYVGRFVDDFPYQGAFVELGLALAFRKEIYIIGKKADKCIFIYEENVRRFDTEEQFLNYIRWI